MVWFYIHEWLIFYGFHVGKYVIYMDVGDGMRMMWMDFYKAFYFLEDYRTEWNHSLVKTSAVEQNFAVGTNMKTLKGKSWCFCCEKNWRLI